MEWLGDVPEHWKMVRASSVAHFFNGKAHEQFVDPEGENICVTARFVSTGGQISRMCTENFCPGQKGDVFMVMSDLPRGRALARAFVVRDDRSYAVNQRVCVYRAHSINPIYLACCANRNPQFLLHDDGFNQTHLSNYDFKTLLIPLPPAEEQNAIVEYIENAVNKIDLWTSQYGKEVALLHEYRTRLIADVVTGKLDVRDAAAQLPEPEQEVVPEELDPEGEEGLEGEAEGTEGEEE